MKNSIYMYTILYNIYGMYNIYIGGYDCVQFGFDITNAWTSIFDERQIVSCSIIVGRVLELEGCGQTRFMGVATARCICIHTYRSFPWRGNTSVQREFPYTLIARLKIYKMGREIRSVQCTAHTYYTTYSVRRTTYSVRRTPFTVRCAFEVDSYTRTTMLDLKLGHIKAKYCCYAMHIDNINVGIKHQRDFIENLNIDQIESQISFNVDIITVTNQQE